MKNLYKTLYQSYKCLVVDYNGLKKYKNQIKEDEEIAKELQNGNKAKS